MWSQFWWSFSCVWCATVLQRLLSVDSRTALVVLSGFVYQTHHTRSEREVDLNKKVWLRMWICISPLINKCPHRQKVQVGHDEVSVFCCLSISICSNSLYRTVFCIFVTPPERKVTLPSEGISHSFIALASITLSTTGSYLLSLLESIIEAQRFALKQIL